jgi:hypothetical protein
LSTNLIPLSDLQRMAQAVASSKLFGVTTPDQALALMLVAQAEGLHPATAARDYHVIQGRPALKADAMLARYLNSGGKVKWLEHSDTKVAAEFAHPNGGTLTIEWDMDRAKKAGLGGKDMWSKYPRQMLRARVISEGIRATNPAVATGVYTVEEVQDMEPARPKREPRNMGKAEVVEVVEVDEDDEKLKLIDTDWSAELKKAKTLEELGATWARMPDAAKRTHAEEKDLLKMQFAA